MAIAACIRWLVTESKAATIRLEVEVSFESRDDYIGSNGYKQVCSKMCLGFVGGEENNASYQLACTMPSKGWGGVGLKCAAVMNKSLLIKLAWRLLNEKMQFGGKIVRSKYGLSFDDLPIIKHKTLASVILRGLPWCSDLLHKGLRWQVKSGRQVRFLGDKWLRD